MRPPHRPETTSRMSMARKGKRCAIPWWSPRPTPAGVDDCCRSERRRRRRGRRRDINRDAKTRQLDARGAVGGVPGRPEVVCCAVDSCIPKPCVPRGCRLPICLPIGSVTPRFGTNTSGLDRRSCRAGRPHPPVDGMEAVTERVPHVSPPSDSRPVMHAMHHCPRRPWSSR